MAGFEGFYYDPALRELLKVQQKCDETTDIEDIKAGIQNVIQLFQAREAYCEAVTSEEGEELKAIDEESRSHPFDKAFKSGLTKLKLEPIMLSGALEGQFLQSMTSISKAKTVLEIGTFMGYGALACAEALPADGRLVTCEYEPYLKDVIRKLLDKSPHGRKIEIRIGPAQDTLLDLAKEGQQFDLIFIDADKDGYLGYFKTIMEKDLLAKEGTVLFDNALYFGLPYMLEIPSDMEGRRVNSQGIQDLNEYLVSRKDLHKVMVPLRDGILMVRRMEETRQPS